MFPFLLFLTQINFALSDLPIHCLHYQVAGKWKFKLSQLQHENNNCGYPHPDRNSIHFQQNYEIGEQDSDLELELRAPNQVFSKTGNHLGDWTMVYDEGFEIKLQNGMKLFTFMKYLPRNPGGFLSENLNDYKSYCDTSRVGWTSEIQKSGCFSGEKISEENELLEKLSLDSSVTRLKKKSSNHHLGYVSEIPYENDDAIFQTNHVLIDIINNDNTSTWRATAHKQFFGKTIGEMYALLGRNRFNSVLPNGQKSAAVKPAKPSLLDITLAQKNPPSLDWRNHNGVNYMNPVRNQASCGSCYALSSLDAFATRFNIERHKAGLENLVFSPQDVLSCSTQNQGCEGGFPYLVAKYGEEVGFVTEDCLTYQASDSKSCNQEASNAKRYKLKDYHYIGGYYGACNEQKIIQELQNGPVAMAFEAQATLFGYGNGIYSCGTPTVSEIQQNEENVVQNWQHTTHAVVGVGYGTEEIHGIDVPYWIIKNSWGGAWGEEGYFRIRRGDNTCAIESMAVTATPVL